MLANLKIKVRLIIHKLALKLHLVTIKCPYCGGENWPEYETARQYHCKNCAKRWNKVDGSTVRYRIHKEG